MALPPGADAPGACQTAAWMTRPGRSWSAHGAPPRAALRLLALRQVGLDVQDLIERHGAHDPLGGPAAGDDRDVPALPPRAGVRVQQQRQAGRVDEAPRSQVEDDERRARLLELHQLLLEPLDVRDVELASQCDVQLLSLIDGLPRQLSHAAVETNW